MRIKREMLLSKLQQVSPGLAKREILEQSGSFIFKDGQILTFNDEILCVADYDCHLEGAVHAQQLLALLSKLPDEEIEIETAEGQFRVKGRGKRAGVAMNAEILLPVDAVELPTAWQSLHSDFGDGLEVVQGSSSKDDLHFNITCIHIEPDYVEACDGYQVTRYKIKTGFKSECLIKKESVHSIVGHNFTELCEGEHWVHFRKPELRISCRRWIQEYPDLSEMINCSGKPTTLPGGLADAVDKAEIFSTDASSEDLIHVAIKNNKLRLRGEGPHGWYEEQKKIAYSGDPISFYIPPKLLMEITKRTNDCQISENRLKIDAGKFIFVACLAPSEES